MSWPLGVAFMNDERQNEELNTRMGNANAMTRTLQYSVAMKREWSKKEKLSVIKTLFVPILTNGHGFWVITERIYTIPHVQRRK